MGAILDEHKSWQDSAGKPLVGGKVYFGVRNQAPKTNLLPAIFDNSSLTPPGVANPQTLDAEGQTDDKIYVPDFYSILVEDKDANMIYTELDNGSSGNTGAPIVLGNVQGVNDLTGEASPVITAYVQGQVYLIKTLQANTGAMTLNGGAGVVSIKLNGDELVADQVPANTIMELTYNSTGPTFDLVGGVVSLAGGVTLRTPQSTSSGDDKDFTAIPAGVKKISVLFNGVGLANTSGILVQIGDAGGIDEDGYVSSSINVSTNNGGTIATLQNNTGFIINTGVVAQICYGRMELSLINEGANTWVNDHTLRADFKEFASGGGKNSLAGVLTQIRITPVSGDFDGSGEVNIQFQ